jgi:hypothetical protein
VRGPLMHSPLEDLSDTLDLNVKSTVLLTRLLAPRIARRGSGGRILFVGSLSAVGPGPSVAVYAATKAFLQSFAMSLRRELISQGVFVTLALPGAVTDTSFASRAGSEDALIFRGPGLSLSVEHTVLDIYRGLKQGRDVVVPGLVNKLYTYLFSQILPSAAVGAITQAAWSPAPKWMPFLKPLASDLLLQEEQRRQKRRLREQQEAARSEEQRKERLRKKQGNRNFFGARAEQARGAGGRPEEWGTALDRDRDGFSSEGDVEGEGEAQADSSGDVILARSGRRKNKLQQFGASCMRSMQQKRARVGDLFKNFTQSLNLPSKDEIIAGCEGPVKKGGHLGPMRKDMDEEDESELEKKLREAVRREEGERQGQGERDVKGPISLFRNVRKIMHSVLTFFTARHTQYCTVGFSSFGAKNFFLPHPCVALHCTSQCLNHQYQMNARLSLLSPSSPQHSVIAATLSTHPTTGAESIQPLGPGVLVPPCDRLQRHQGVGSGSFPPQRARHRTRRRSREPADR